MIHNKKIKKIFKNYLNKKMKYKKINNNYFKMKIYKINLIQKKNLK